VDVVTEKAIGLFNYFFSIAQIKSAAAGGADEIPVVHVVWVDYEWFIYFFCGFTEIQPEG
jgi:hypothetical protein